MDFLRLPNWRIIDYEENNSYVFIRAKYELQAENCLKCYAPGKYLHRYGTRLKTVKDFPAQGKYVFIKLSIQRYKCLSCKKTFVQNVNEIADKMRITKRLVTYIEKQCIEKPFLTISQNIGVDENIVREIFTKYAEREQKKQCIPTPEVLGIDDVYIEKKARCVMTDIKKKRFFGLYKNIDAFNVEQYLIDIKNKEIIKVVTMDMSRAFRCAVRKILGNVIIVVDKYHIQRMSKGAVDLFLGKIRESLNTSKRRKYLRDRFLLYKRSYNLSPDSRQKLIKWGQDFPELVEIYNLKENFLQIWNNTKKEKAIQAFNVWKNKIPIYLNFAFKKILTAFKGWADEIFNYFDYPVTNAYTESVNNLIKSIQKQSRGSSFESVRARMFCRSFNKLAEDEKNQLPTLNQFSFVKPKKHQRGLRLKKVRQQTSEVFALLFPRESSWFERFKPYLPLLHKNK
jgi:transposase